MQCRTLHCARCVSETEPGTAEGHAPAAIGRPFRQGASDLPKRPYAVTHG